MSDSLLSWDYRYQARKAPPRCEWWAPLLSGRRRIPLMALWHYADSYVKPLLLWRRRARNHR